MLLRGLTILFATILMVAGNSCGVGLIPFEVEAEQVVVRGGIDFGETVFGDFSEIETTSGFVFAAQSGSQVSLRLSVQSDTRASLLLYGPKAADGSWGEPLTQGGDALQGADGTIEHFGLRADGQYLIAVAPTAAGPEQGFEVYLECRGVCAQALEISECVAGDVCDAADGEDGFCLAGYCAPVQIDPDTGEENIRIIVGFERDIGTTWAVAQTDWGEAIRFGGGQVLQRFTRIDGVAATLPVDSLDMLLSRRDVELLEPDIELRAMYQSVPWGVTKVGAPAAHAVTKGAGVKVAVIDSGVNYNHADLQANYVGGYDFVNNDNDPADDQGHGTKCAGVIAAADNSIGMIGVAPEASLYALKVLSSSGAGYSSNIIRAIEWSVDHDIDIVSMSIGSNGASASYQRACDDAYQAGVLLVAAAGNSGTGDGDTVMYPAKFQSVIAVSATSSSNYLAGFSSRGPAVELAAPGLSLRSTVRSGGYGSFSGTSAATPYVAGVAALLMSADPSLSNVEVRQRMQQNALDLGSQGRDNLYGFGLVQAVITPPTNATDDLDISITPNQTDLTSGQSTQVTVRATSGGLPVAGVTVALGVTGGSLNPQSGTTDADGEIVATYVAPSVTVQTDVYLTASGTKTGYQAASASQVMTVGIVESGEPQLDVTIIMAEVSLASGQDTQVTIRASSGGIPVAGVDVTASDYGSGVLMPSVGTTDANGNVSLVYSAPVVTAQTYVAIVAHATRSGYTAGQDQHIFAVNPGTATMPKLDVAVTATAVLLEAGQQTQVTLHASSEGGAVAGAQIIVGASGGFVDPNTGNTDSNGDFVVTFSAPPVTTQTEIVISAAASKAGYLMGSATQSITVNPAETGARQFDIAMTAGAVTLQPGQSTWVTIRATDSGTPVAGADVALLASGGSLAPTSGSTDSNGTFMTTYTAPVDSSETLFSITAAISKADFLAAESQFTITVMDEAQPPTVGLPESPRPYSNNFDETWVVSRPGASYIRVRFEYIFTEARYDFVHLYDKNGAQIAKYDGYHRDAFWSPWVAGDALRVRMTTDGSSIREGFKVDQVETQ